MPSDKLSGIYFGETVGTIAENTDMDEVLFFIVQTSSAIADLDNKLTLFTSMSSFKTKTNNKGLTRTVKFIEDVMGAVGSEEFYVYSVKTDTSAGFKEAVSSTRHLKEVRKAIYYEETKSANGNTISSKMTAITTACNEDYVYGAFKVGYVVPYGTVSDAVTSASSVAPETTVVSTFTTLLNGDGSGRMCVIMPDNENAIMATIASKKYNEEVGNGYVTGSVASLTYNFTYAQMLTLRNLGVLFIRPKRVDGITNYEIELGVNTAFKDDSADGLIVCRGISDELLHQVDIVLDPFIKDKEVSSNVSFAQTAVDGVIADFVNAEDVISDGTKLTVSDAGNMKFAVNGTIQPVRSIIAIEVNTTIQ